MLDKSATKALCGLLQCPLGCSEINVAPPPVAFICPLPIEWQPLCSHYRTNQTIEDTVWQIYPCQGGRNVQRILQETVNVDPEPSVVSFRVGDECP